MKLSIIVPAYNAGRYIEECLMSCIRQDLSSDNYEIIVIDDGSTDDTLSIAERMASEHGIIKVFHQENQGLSLSRNKGVALSDGKYIMFVDSDDILATDCLASLTDRCQADDLDILQFCAADMKDGNHERRMTYPEAGRTLEGKTLLKRKIQVCAPFAVYRREFLTENSLSFYPGIYHEDDEFKTRAIYLAQRVCSINDIVYFVRPAEGSITRRVYAKKSYDCLIVIDSLARFAEEKVEKNDRGGIYLQIAHAFNWCLQEMTLLPHEDAEKLEKEISGRKEIFGYLCLSTSLLHKVEGCLMKIFPRHPLTIYKTLSFLHFGKKHR